MLPKGTRRRRCVVLADGSAIGCYQRNAHETHTVVLEASGHSYSYIQPDGTRSRHLTPTALSSHRALVVDTLNLRNRFTDKLPYLHLRLMNARYVSLQRRIRAPRARWPASGGKVKVSRLYNSDDKCFEMQSIEGAAKVRLHASGKLVEIFYLVEVKVSDDEVEEETNRAHYATLHQTFAVDQTPESFALPVETLVALKAAWDHDRGAEFVYGGMGVKESNLVISQLPRNGAFAARPAFSVIATRNDGVQMPGEQENSLSLAEILRVATLPSKLLYHRVVAEVLGDDSTLVVSRKADNSLPELVVQMDGERSLLTGGDGFFTWYGETGRCQHRFTRETVPPSSTIDTKSSSHSVVSLCQHVDYVLQALRYPAQMNNQDNRPDSPLGTDELKLVEKVENEHGRFRAFRDGRVRIAFADRTILQVERDGECCSFFFPDGNSAKTTLASAPLRHRAYIYQALEFGDWAFSTQEERMQRHVKRQEAQAVVARELQRISVRCGMNTEIEILQQECSKDSSVKCDKQKEQCHAMQIDAENASLALSLATVRELQAATLQHIASVDHALKVAAAHDT
ncbi:hypothetical protein PRNP1_005578 [Phytophthora ramorum]